MLASTPGVGDVTFARLLETFGSAASALTEISSWPRQGADGRLAKTIGVRTGRGIAAAISTAADTPTATEDRVRGLDGWIVTPLDTSYPPRLHALDEPPAVLYGLGHPDVLRGARSVSVVGTRRPSAAGRDLANRIATRLAESGIIVVSGLAVGIDGAAHRATLDAGGATIGVIGGGIDRPGPAGHRRLAHAILRDGAIVSELAPGVAPTKGTFPRRNRIISALSIATVVVEAPARSGALITARHALEQGRRLLVAPGRPLDPRVAGCLALLRESPAMIVAGLDEMLADIGLGRSSPGAGSGRSGSTGIPPAILGSLGASERAIATALAAAPGTVDSLVQTTALEPGVVAAALTILELRGWVRVHGAVHLAAGPLLARGVQADDGPRDGSGRA